MKITAIISRFLLGIVFIFSGFVKAVDPLGSTYKFIDYFTAFGMPFLEHLALPLAILLSAAEFVIGISLIIGLRMKLSAIAAGAFMAFFTVLTFFLAIFNPVSDCGCFGDAIILTNWQTFFKNLFFLLPTVIIFLYRNKYSTIFDKKVEWLFVSVFSVLIIGVSIYGYRHLPIIDFRPYNIGTYIPEKMEVPESAPQDIYESIFYYEKDGEVRQFTKDNYPWQDTTWKFVDAEHILVKQGYIPPIHDFGIENKDQGDITEEILNKDGYYFLIVSSTLEEANIEGSIRINEFVGFYQQYNISSVCMTSSIHDEISEYKQKVNPLFDFYNTDEITLKTMVRSNPGVVLLHKGTIIDKWHYNDIPLTDELDINLIGNTILKYKDQKDSTLIYAFILFGILVFSFYGIFKNYYKRL
jgi:uncharacterized membrane protein YphA (DoxX/SURF4 family)